MQRWVGIVVLSALSVMAHANEPLPGDIVRDLNGLQSQLAEQPSGEADSDVLKRIANHARSQATRLASGNRADQWASALYHQLAASALVRQGDHLAAADELASAQQRPSVPNSQILRWLRDEASLRRAGGQRTEAITLYDQWLTQSQGNPHYDESAWRLVRLLAQEERWDAAADWLSPLLQKGGLTDTQQTLATVVLRNAGQNEQALGWLVSGLNAQSEPDAWRQAAGLAQQAGRAGVAAGVWEMAWQLGKLTATEDRLTLIRLHLAGGTPARAGEHLDAAIQEGALPRDEETLRLLASAWQQAKDIEKALSAWEALAESTQKAEDWRQYGQLAYHWGQNGQAEQAFIKAVNLGDDQAGQWLSNF
jgi:tetratricopeptide (TPR) repeat protein